MISSGAWVKMPTHIALLQARFLTDSIPRHDDRGALHDYDLKTAT